MFTVGANRKRSNVARQGRSWAQCSADSRLLAVDSLSRAAAVSSMARSAAEAGRAGSAKPSIAGSPSDVTSGLSAWTRWNVGLSSRARLLESPTFHLVQALKIGRAHV